MKNNSIDPIVSEIDLLMSLESAAELNRLTELVDLYFNHDRAEEFLDVWFRLYERFPDDETEGIFWSILHGIEQYHPDSDRLVVSSVRRNTSEFPMMMVNRLLNGGIKKVDTVDLLQLLEGVTTNDIYSTSIRETARSYIDYQRNKL
jgi:hypothetical protein